MCELTPQVRAVSTARRLPEDAELSTHVVGCGECLAAALEATLAAVGLQGSALEDQAAFGAIGVEMARATSEEAIFELPPDTFGQASVSRSNSGLIDLKAISGLGSVAVVDSREAEDLVRGSRPLRLFAGAVALVAVAVGITLYVTPKPGSPIPETPTAVVESAPPVAMVSVAPAAVALAPSLAVSSTAPASVAAPPSLAALDNPALAAPPSPTAGGASPRANGSKTEAAPTSGAVMAPAPNEDEPAAAVPTVAPPSVAVAAAPVEKSGPDEVDDLLGALDGGGKKKPVAAAAAPEDPAFPDQLTKSQIISVMKKAASTVKGCQDRMPDFSGLVPIKVQIDRGGKVTGATSAGAAQGTPIGACVESVVRGLQFPQFSGEPMSVTFPFSL